VRTSTPCALEISRHQTFTTHSAPPARTADFGMWSIRATEKPGKLG
jgi:hypothetical protein